jgi:CRISPR/Cas system CSM-associated protein Csm3 (group 7 of RAMP superfamily)
MTQAELTDPIVWVARVILEAATPLHIGSGRGDEVSDADVVRDVNGLPTIPGTSLTGVLRQAYEARRGIARHENELFGYQSGKEGSGSRLWVSFGRLLDGEGKVVEGLRDEGLSDDEVLAAAREGVVRDHVRLTADGVADVTGRGKFDERLVPVGARFLVELTLTGDERHAEDFEFLVGLLGDDLRVGGHTRRGLGCMTATGVQRRRFDLRKAADVEDYERLSPRLVLDDVLGALAPPPRPECATKDEARAGLTLVPQSPWGVGGVAQDEEADITLLSEPRIQWDSQQRGRVVEDYVLPASSLKGAIAHRVAFHDNVLRKRFAGAEGDAAPTTGEDNPSVSALFGEIKADDRGSPGRVFLSDIRLPRDETESHVITHNGIDRFTGGTRCGVLFQERVLPKGISLETHLVVRPTQDTDPTALEALKRTLRDLERGWLQVGHGYGRGNGWFKGTLEWTAGQDWLEGGEA